MAAIMAPESKIPVIIRMAAPYGEVRPQIRLKDRSRKSLIVASLRVRLIIMHLPFLDAGRNRQPRLSNANRSSGWRCSAN
jgi:hypothetical protein